MRSPKLSMKKKTAAFVSAGIITVAGAGAAFAYWTTTGEGTGSATTASANGTVVLSAAFDSGIAPGQSRTVTYTGANAGDTDLYVGTIHAVVSTSNAYDADTNPTGCKASDFSIADVTPNTVVPSAATATDLGTGTLAFANSAANQDGCKGATITLTLSSD